MSGTQDIVIAGGVEVMSLVPIGSNVVDGLSNGRGHPYLSEGMNAKYPEVGGNFSQVWCVAFLIKFVGYFNGEFVIIHR